MKDEEVISYQLSVIINHPQFPIPHSPFPSGGDLIDLGIEPKIDRFCNEVSFGAPFPIPASPLSRP